MTDLRQAAQAVLERWDAPLWKTGTTAAAIADLRTALEQPKQEPVAWMVKLGDVTCFQHHADSKHASVPLYTTPPAAQPEQVVDCPRCGHVCSQREWVGLTDEEIDYQAKKDDHGVYFALGALWANAKLKERNT
jgi:hypothetical protein